MHLRASTNYNYEVWDEQKINYNYKATVFRGTLAKVLIISVVIHFKKGNKEDQTFTGDFL